MKYYDLLAEVMGGQRASRDEHWIGRGVFVFCCYCWTSDDICCIVGQGGWGILGLGMNYITSLSIAVIVKLI